MTGVLRTEEFGEVCRVLVGELPRSGALVSPTYVLLCAAVLVVMGAVALVLLRYWPGSGLAAALALLLVVSLPLPDAAAAPAGVSYGEGCALIEVGDAEIDDAFANGMLPGDGGVAVQATVVNRFEASLMVRLEAEVEGKWAEVVEATPRFGDGGSDAQETLTLAPGERQIVQLELAAPRDVGNEYQGAEGSFTLVIILAQGTS